MRDGDGSHLLRVLGVAFGIAAVIGGTIGQGILRAPGLVASGVPDARFIIALWIAGGVIAAIDAMSTVELAASLRKTGGSYVFVTRAFGRFAGLAAGIAIWLGYGGVAAFVSVVVAEYLHRLGIGTSLPIQAIAIAAVALTAGIQALGTRIGGASQEVGSTIKALIYLALVAALLLAPRGAAVAVPPPPEITAVGLIIAIRGIVGTYLGWESCAFFGEEIKDAGRSIARATFTGIALVTIIYVLVNVAMLSVLSPQEMAGSNLVAADAAARVFGPWGATVVTAVSLISLLTLLNVVMMTVPRLLYVIARDAGVPGLSHVAANGSPQIALAVMAVTVALLALVGVYGVLLAFSVWLMTGTAATVNASAIVLRRREPELERPFRMPLFPLPAIFALLVNLSLLAAFLYESPLIVLQATALLAVVAGGLYFLTRRTASA